MKELFDHLVKNKATLIAQKKAEMKRADGISVSIQSDTKKAAGDGDMLATLIINTTNLMDSHKDVHLPGLWKKSLSENKMIMLLQEHAMQFDKIIADGDDLKAYTKQFTWKQLGYDYEGTTEALVFEAKIKADRNPKMAKEYRMGRVKNHSVGMQYVKLLLAINDEDYDAEYEAWQKYYPEIANKETADEQSYFWVVKEAKVIEGSAVPLGSNFATPTISIEPLDKSTHDKEPPTDGTHVDFINELKNINLF